MRYADEPKADLWLEFVRIDCIGDATTEHHKLFCSLFGFPVYRCACDQVVYVYIPVARRFQLSVL